MPALGGELGGQCRGETFECNGNLTCLPQQDFVVGGPDDPIRDYPPGESESFTVSEFQENYCTAVLPPSSPATQCGTANAQACAQECGLCTVFTNADICLRGCRAEADTNSTCRDGYECDLLFDVCDVGCSSDDDCRVFREDTNDNGEFDPWDPVTMTGDQLVYDTESTYVCNSDTNRCEHPGMPGAEAGDACEGNQDCEANGTCLDEDFFGFPGGYCSKVRCDIDPCAGDGICAALGLGVPLCAESCQVGAGATPGDPSTYLGNTQGCRDEYTCFWGGFPDDRTGACVPGVFNDVTENNIGDDCTEASECYSPFGQGACGDADLVCALIGEEPGACQVGFGCTVFDCAAPGMPGDVCGIDGDCVVTSAGLSLCVAKCSAAESCLPGAACADLDRDLQTPDTVCLPFCIDSSECRAGESCNSLGECAPAQ
ncbi:MAG: hypothetical protein JRG93_06490 [Deltaproteobacteria bacterium]|nr:hypothetical protein [Deltaproteobacteria bacterium]